MEQRTFDRKPTGKVQVDVCFGCHGIWFDQFESAALTPGGVIGLFRTIHEHPEQPPRPLGEVLKCPTCRGRLALTNDLQRSNRITYYRCPRGDGRLSTFFQFLREKEFVRDLTRPEIERLRESVKQVRCSSCGAPVDLARDAQCKYCRSPISILDADAVRKTLAELGAQERGRTLGDPRQIVEGLLSGRRRPFDGPVDAEAALQAVLAHDRGGKPRRGQPSRRAASSQPARASRGERGGILDLVSDALGDFLSD